jgi:hypothetical protein
MTAQTPIARDPLEVAGEKLDQAAAAFRDYCSSPLGEPTEVAFGRLEDELETARATYRSLLAERVGADVSVIEGRLSR